jgi:ribosomal protein L37AE/L43A
MPIRPSWFEDYWDKQDKNVSDKIRTTCPRCGSSRTYYNQQYQVWRCGRCEHSFVIEGLRGRRPWWKRFFGRG